MAMSEFWHGDFGYWGHSLKLPHDFGVILTGTKVVLLKTGDKGTVIEREEHERVVAYFVKKDNGRTERVEPTALVIAGI